MKRGIRGTSVGVALLAAGAALAQQAPQNLEALVNASPSVTPLQRSTGVGVQRMCIRLAQAGGAQLPANTPQLDLFLRCNELVETAFGLTGGAGAQVDRSLGFTSPEPLFAAVQQVSGEELSTQGALATNVTAGQFSNISGRLNALRFGTATAASRGRLASLLGPYGEGARPLGGAAGADASAGEVGLENRVGWFVEGNYNTGDRDQTPNEDAFDFDVTSATIGLDYNIGSFVVGVSAGYDTYEADFEPSALVAGGDLAVDGYSGTVFGAWFAGRLFVDAIVNYGSLSSDLTRRVVYAPAVADPTLGTDRTIVGSPDGDYLTAGATAGVDFAPGGWDVSTSLSLTYRDVSIDGYDETDLAPAGGLALRFAEQDIESLRTILALAVSRSISRPFGVLAPVLRLEWHREFEDDVRVLQAKYVVEDTLGTSAPQDFGPACISCFGIPTDEPDTDFGVAGVGLTLTFTRRVQAFAYFERVVGLTDLDSNSIALGVRGQF